MVIGLHGKIGAGKNAAARRLALLHPDVVEVSFAAKLKESAAALLCCTVDDLEQWKNDPLVRVEIVRGDHVWSADGADEAGLTVRSFLQRYGTESHRDIFGYDFWTNRGLPLDCDYSDALYVVTDIRFENETQRVRDVGGLVVGLVGAHDTPSDHASERAVECDVWIDNTVRDDDYANLDAELRALLAFALPLAA